VQKLLDTKNPVGDHVRGVLPSQQGTSPAADLTSDEKALAAVYGLLLRDGQVNPGVNLVAHGNVVGAEPDPNQRDAYRRFAEDLSVAHGRYRANRALFDAVLPVLVREGDKTGENFVRAEQWATVVKILIMQNVSADDIHLRLKTTSALESISGGGGGDGVAGSNVEIDLPDLDAFGDIEIHKDHLFSAQTHLYSAMLEQSGFFQVVDKLVELFQAGLLPIGRGPAGDMLYSILMKGPVQLREADRRNAYARMFGYPGGDSTIGNPNREFNDLFMRFISAVSSFVRQSSLNSIVRADLPLSISQEGVRKAARDLAANLSLQGYGISYFMAAELQKQIRDYLALLSDKEVMAAYGAQSPWQLVDQVMALELGGAKNGVRYRAMARAIAVIVAWLASKARELSGASPFTSIIDLNQVRNPPPRPSGTKPTTQPNDYDLVQACEEYIAVTGTSDSRVEEYAQPVEGPIQPSIPLRMPPVAQDLLDSVGVPAGMGGMQPAVSFTPNVGGGNGGNGKH
jgi:hypothetical protein